MGKSKFSLTGIELDWINKFVEHIDFIDFEIKPEQAVVSLECALVEIDSLRSAPKKI
ncbi:hypothetical protein HNQ06_000988 [Borrelia lanei]|uniref:Uncharacterized protein n=1 Tax=Borreliella lanei TaxID=373540 RepID=A0A7X0DK13_9SPIR|nr:hypothetical protein [Borreliella lanei]